MGAGSKIEWCDHTFNPWMGCTKVSEGCAHCYAEAMMDRRYGKVQWGAAGARVRTSAQLWRQPLRWNDSPWFQCEVCGRRGNSKDFVEHNKTCRADTCNPTRQRVFCGSLMDAGDVHPSVAREWVDDLVRLIEATPNLDWLLLTKRPEDVLARFGTYWGMTEWPGNVWCGVSVENQAAAEARIPVLQQIPAVVRFLSVEPMLGYIDMSEAVKPEEEDWDYVNASRWEDDPEPEEYVPECEEECDWINCGDDLVYSSEHREWVERRRAQAGFQALKRDVIDWVICGGESGAEARPMSPIWARGLRDECRAAGVAFFFKQWGEWAPFDQLAWATDETLLKHRPVEMGGVMMCRVEKHLAGRVLDGRTWDETPIPAFPQMAGERRNLGEGGGEA